MPRTLDDHLRDRRARVASWLEQRTEAETATAVCERWIADLLARGVTLYSRQDLGSLAADLSLVDRLSAEKLDGLSAALAWQIEDAEGKEPHEAALIGHALAAASGHAYAVRGPGKLDWIGHFVASIDGASWEVFAEFCGGGTGHESRNVGGVCRFPRGDYRKGQRRAGYRDRDSAAARFYGVDRRAVRAGGELPGGLGVGPGGQSCSAQAMHSRFCEEPMPSAL